MSVPKANRRPSETEDGGEAGGGDDEEDEEDEGDEDEDEEDDVDTGAGYRSVPDPRGGWAGGPGPGPCERAVSAAGARGWMVRVVPGPLGPRGPVVPGPGGASVGGSGCRAAPAGGVGPPGCAAGWPSGAPRHPGGPGNRPASGLRARAGGGCVPRPVGSSGLPAWPVFR
ncbi:hypothetical protein GCM10010236_20270 [Streptomyces eurythermus]|nr:hypothetical protein GCM10010236_20270 [Streptomyces eurythermus]